MTHIRHSEKVFIMKRLLLILILTFSVQSWIKADDIRDFEIEGMSIGDSLLDYYSEKKITKNIRNWYRKKEVIGVEIIEKKGPYDSIQIHFKKDDKNYKIIGVAGLVFYRKNNINDCYEKQKIITDELKQVFPKTRLKYGKRKSHFSDKSGKSKTTTNTFYLSNKGEIDVACYDWTKKMKWWDNLRVVILSSELKNFVNSL